MSRLEIYSPEGLRLDGRRWNELRRFECSTTNSGNHDGSSYLEQGQNKIITIVNGPMEPNNRSQINQSNAILKVSINITKFSKMKRSKSSHKNEKRVLEMQIALERTFNESIMLHLYPRTLIEISIHVLQQDGGLMGCLINGITLALIDAGISMYDYISGVSIGLLDQQPLLDLNYLEETAMSMVTIGVLGRTEKLSMLLVEDRIPLDRLESVLSIGIAGAHRIRDLMDSQLRKNGAKRLSKINK
ncbi:exosome non-catalytic core subunit SKI6 SCDLUD_004453 [Saccharomycodes ludwigii]|uniref:exosome non-catalytic core subunit SKI6 n=1 Tax=Saccharomycodes ludwigii TaxID=36035 RepID=UPI001E8C6AF6|nr:hypothetical protein SCDLUD_004453 [Saccharomycodes ludwigii]KAH3899031.1 hypothetical protein SCDLUD_004453 [Saccharomycodes ludwigii]